MKSILLFLLTVSLIACSEPSAKRSVRSSENVLRLNIGGDPNSLDPRIGVGRRAQVINNMLFEGLTRVSAAGQPALGLAERVEISPDGTEYTFHLRSTLWSTGEPVTAFDFEQGWKRAVSPDFDTPFTWLFQLITGARAATLGEGSVDDVGVHAIDDHTLVVQLDHPAPYFLDLIAIPAFAPIPSFLDREGNGWSESAETHISNGPFVLERWKHDDQIVLVKNPNYWDADAVQLDGISFTMVADAHSALAMFENGELDWVGEPLSELSHDSIRRLNRQGTLESTPVFGVYFYDFNTQQPPFTSLKVRKAFAAAIDRRSIIDNILTGREEAAGSILPPALSLHDGSLLESLSKEEARQLFEEGLAEIGLDRSDLEPIRLTYGMIEGQRQLAQAVQQQWQEAFDITIELDSLEWKAYLSRILSHDFQICGVTWFSWLPDPIYNLERHKYLTDQFNTMQWADDRYVELLDASDREVDPERRLIGLQMAEALVMQDVPSVPVYVPNYYYIKRDGVEGIMINDLGLVDFKHCTIRPT